MKSFRRKSLPTAILAVSLLFSGCRQQFDIDLTEDNSWQTEEAPSVDLDFAAESTVNIELSTHRISCDHDSAQKILTALSTLKRLDYTDLTVYDDYLWGVSVSGSSAGVFSRSFSDKGYIIYDRFMNVYEDNADLANAVMECISADNSSRSGQSKEPYFTADCPEPNTEEEYRKAAIDCVNAWLTSLQSPDTDEYYRNKSFEITEADEGGRTKSNYLSCGTVNGRKEFAVEICFTAEDCGDGTFYDKFYQEGRYTEAGTYWSGNYICGRFAWENGKCSLLDFTGRNGSEGIQKGLNGIHQGEYKTFFDFARRSDLQQAIDESFVARSSVTVSKNLTQTEDGKPINIDIYMASMPDAEAYTEDAYTAIWDVCAYINGEPTYSTGLYFTDYGTGHMPDTLPKDFKLTFDNYDGDANPDYCVRYDSDENGTFYCLDSVQSDGRIFGLSGRAFEGGIYIAGCTDPSPRLQKTDYYSYIGWKVDNGRYYPTDENGREIELPELNMYSDRYYLPDDLKFYSEDENAVTCFLWNNTDRPVTTENTYSIVYLENGQWETAAENLPAEAVTVDPREHAEITYDISALKTRYNTYYLIVQECDSRLTAFGAFCLEGESIESCEYQAENVALGQNMGKFTFWDSPIISTALFPNTLSAKDDSGEYPLTILYDLSIPYGDGKIEMYYSTSGLPPREGEYTLIADGVPICPLKVTGYAKFPELSVEAAINDGNINLTLTPDQDLELTDISFLEKTERGFAQTPAAVVDTEDYFDYSDPDILKANVPVSYKTFNYMEERDEESIRDIYELFKEIVSESEDADDFSDLTEELGVTADIDYEGFKDTLVKYLSIDESRTYMVLISYNAGESSYQKIFII
ncbi:MAG: hypothetical protein NC203_08315 [Firmicutes bacterium]|nr:hypothetical protein [[Eubacterium] siraeum]MCM1488354.1 hypothetical protein [Bacillota bacterium]